MFRKVAPVAGTVALGLLFYASCRKPPKAPTPGGPQLASVRFFDVGQGDSALLSTAEGVQVLFDTGPNGTAARRLRELGVKRIDLLVLSHPHRDHDGGVKAVARAVAVKQVWYSNVDRWPPAIEALKPVAVRAGESLSLSGLRLKVIHPDASEHRNVNDNSLVVRAEYNGASYLFPGDCELPCWDDLFRNHRSDLRSDVLKAAHHGSQNGTNSGVLVNVRPRAFVISCGRDNQFGHPDGLVIRLVEKLGADLFRTDQMGEIRCAGARCAVAQ
jgi:competence protein ComEC